MLWDDGTTREYFSNSLKKERSFALLPPDVRPPRLLKRMDKEQQEEIDENEQDKEMEEDLPGAGKESYDND